MTYKVSVRDKDGYICSEKNFSSHLEALAWAAKWIELGWYVAIEPMTIS